MRKFTTIVTTGLTALFCALAGPSPSLAQNNSTVQEAPLANGVQRGWLEGTVLNEQGEPVQTYDLTGGVQVKGTRRGGGTFEAASDTSMGGLYSVQNLTPGIYDLAVAKGQVLILGQGSHFYRPQRIFGVVVKPGVRTALPITLEEGDTLEDVGQPAVTEQGLLVSQELARLQKQIDDLKSQLKDLAQLRAQVQALTTKASGPPAAGTAAP